MFIVLKSLGFGCFAYCEIQIMKSIQIFVISAFKILSYTCNERAIKLTMHLSEIWNFWVKMLLME